MNFRNIIKIRANFVLLLILCICGFSSLVCNAQYQGLPTIENPIVFGWGRDLDKPGVPAYFGDIPSYAKFYFEDLPSLFRDAVLSISIQARYDFDKPILIRISGSLWTLDIAPSEVHWPSPIHKGDIFECKARVRPKEIGTHYLSIGLSDESSLSFAYNFNFNIDESGKTNHLSQRSYPPALPNHLPLNYLKDTLIIEYPKITFMKKLQREAFKNTFTITPIPSMGDTVDIQFSITAINDYPEGVQLRFIATDNLEVLSVPKNWTGSVKEEEIYQGIIKVLFKKPGESRICLVPEGNYYDEQDQNVRYINKLFYLSFVIDPDGKLTYVGREAKELYKTDRPSGGTTVLGEKAEWPGEREYIFLPKVKVLQWKDLKKSEIENK